MEWIDRELAELIWQESLDMMTPEEIAEMVRRQDEAQANAIEWEAELDALREMEEAAVF